MKKNKCKDCIYMQKSGIKEARSGRCTHGAVYNGKRYLPGLMGYNKTACEAFEKHERR